MKAILFFISCAIFISCNSEDESTGATTPKEVKVIMPLAVGNAWTFSIRSVVPPSKETTTTAYTVTLTNRSTINAEYWYSSNGGLMFTNRVSGLWEGSSAASASLYLRYPVSKGETFGVGTGTPMLVHVRSVDSLITIPAGTFPCVVYTYDDSSRYIEHLYAVNVGEVRSTVIHRTGAEAGQYSQWTLKSYSLK